MLQDANKRVKTVDVYYGLTIFGLKFYDKYHSLIFEIGKIASGMGVETVALADDEMIVGIVAKIWGDSAYSDF